MEKESTKERVGFVSLGCDKNRADTEYMIAATEQAGYEICPQAEEADIIVVNTCAFIESAQQEAIDTILEMSEYKKTGKLKKLIVTGCLPQRYPDLNTLLPEADIFLGVRAYDKIAEAVGGKFDFKKQNCIHPVHRTLTTPYTYAYLKIADGCNNRCTYCVIPKIRGNFESRPIENIVEEVKLLTEQYPIKELILVAQDTLFYGRDLYEKNAFFHLIEKLEKFPIERLRILYAYPERVDKETVDFICEHPKLCGYLDIPLQHIDDGVLKRMGRRIDERSIRLLLDRVRSAKRKIALRSTFIAGFPGESEQQFEKLLDFIKQAQFDYAGFFAYSDEDRAASYRLSGKLPQSEKEARVFALQQVQDSLMRQKGQQWIGKTCKVLFEGIDYDKQLFYGRSEFQAPDIDNIIYFESEKPVEVGEIYDIIIDETIGIDLKGRNIL